MPAYDNVVDALNGLKQRGYTTDFNLAFNEVKCIKTGVCLAPDQFEITEHYRFEGMSNPDDSSVVYAIQQKNGSLKGVLVSAYGMYSDTISDAMIRKLSVQSH